MYFIDEIIDFINKNVDSWVLATLILLWAIIFPQYTGIYFICLGRNYECNRKVNL